jgi:serine protease AprX
MKQLLAAMLLLFPLLAWQGPEEEAWRQKVDISLLEKTASGGQVSFLIVLRAQADVSGSRHLRTKAEKGRYVFERLQETARQSQSPVLALLAWEQAPHRSYYIANMILAQGSLPLIRRLAELEAVAQIQDNPEIRMEEPFAGGVGEEQGELAWRTGMEWGPQRIKADQVWALGHTGQGVVIGGQDTGYEWGHPAIKERYRGWDGSSADHNYHWHDAIHEISPLHNDSVISPSLNPCGLDSPVPCDDHNHGTHTMGIMVGGDSDRDTRIGVAPGARWIACRNMERGYGSPATYAECFEWFLAPTDLSGANPEPELAPHVINNSWSCPEIEGCNPSNFALMQIVVDNLRAAGIVVVVSAGNRGSECATVNAPAAIFESSFSVGATRWVDTIANFSSRGPVLVDGSGRLKPNVSAPGVNVRSAIRGGGFTDYSGTSMAGPHVAGLVALMISANPALSGQVELIEQIVEQTAKPMLTDQDCGPFSGLEVPNAAYGYGRVDALAAVEAALALTNISQPEDRIRIQVFPSPARTDINFAAEELEQPARLQLFSLSGQLLYQSQWAAGQAQERISLEGWAAGVYAYRLVSDGRIWAGKWVKQ